MSDPFDLDEAELSPYDGEEHWRKEPTWKQQGVDVPGLLEGQYQSWLRGGFNMDFATPGIPDPTLDIDVASSPSGSNFVPGWRFVQSSNTNITLRQNRDTNVPSGSNLRFTFASGSANDEAYLETILPVRGSIDGEAADVIDFWAKASSAGVGTIIPEAQYLRADGVITGARTTDITTNIGTSYTRVLMLGGNNNQMAPTDARYLRFRLRVKRNAGTGAFTMDVADGQRYTAQPLGLVVGDLGDPTKSPGMIRQSNGYLRAESDIFNGGPSGPIGVQMVALPFAFNNIPANTTDGLLFSDIANDRGRTPALEDGWVVGLAYNISTALAAGTLSLRVIVNGANVWTAHNGLTSGSPTTDVATQAIGTDAFSQGDSLGVEFVTSAAFAPTTMDVSCVLYVAYDWSGL